MGSMAAEHMGCKKTWRPEVVAVAAGAAWQSECWMG